LGGLHLHASAGTPSMSRDGVRDEPKGKSPDCWVVVGKGGSLLSAARRRLLIFHPRGRSDDRLKYIKKSSYAFLKEVKMWTTRRSPAGKICSITMSPVGGPEGGGADCLLRQAIRGAGA